MASQSSSNDASASASASASTSTPASTPATVASTSSTGGAGGGAGAGTTTSTTATTATTATTTSKPTTTTDSSVRKLAIEAATAMFIDKFGPQAEGVKAKLEAADTGVVLEQIDNLITVAEENTSASTCEAVEALRQAQVSAPGFVVQPSSAARRLSSFAPGVASAVATSSAAATLGTKLALWRGDITRLQIDGIVNAANNRMLGCFTVGHKCIDNVIHARAGPRLRNACRAVLSKRGFTVEPTGAATVTPAFALPSKHVLHTVGPIAQYEGHEQPKELASCYRACLDAARTHGMRSIAFCCISTGVFGYPAKPAAAVALDAVMKWLQESDNAAAMDLVLFNVYMPADLEIYEALFTQWASKHYTTPTAATATAAAKADTAESSSTPAASS